MLEIINNLRPFAEDCYRRINVREYSRIMKISPPTASKTLCGLFKEGLLMMEKERNYIFYYANKNSKVFRDLTRISWRMKLNGLTDYITKEMIGPTIILFGSLSKAETKMDSDIDICVIGQKKELNLAKFEKELKRNIQIFFYRSISDISNKELANNILNGYILEGGIR